MATVKTRKAIIQKHTDKVMDEQTDWQKREYFKLDRVISLTKHKIAGWSSVKNEYFFFCKTFFSGEFPRACREQWICKQLNVATGTRKQQRRCSAAAAAAGIFFSAVSSALEGNRFWTNEGMYTFSLTARDLDNISKRLSIWVSLNRGRFDCAL